MSDVKYETGSGAKFSVTTQIRRVNEKGEVYEDLGIVSRRPATDEEIVVHMHNTAQKRGLTEEEMDHLAQALRAIQDRREADKKNGNST